MLSFSFEFFGLISSFGHKKSIAYASLFNNELKDFSSERGRARFRGLTIVDKFSMMGGRYGQKNSLAKCFIRA